MYVGRVSLWIKLIKIQLAAYHSVLYTHNWIRRRNTKNEETEVSVQPPKAYTQCQQKFAKAKEARFGREVRPDLLRRYIYLRKFAICQRDYPMCFSWDVARDF